MASDFKIVRYVGGVGLERRVPLPESQQTTIPGSKAIKMSLVDARELLRDNFGEFEELGSETVPDMDFTNPTLANEQVNQFLNGLEKAADEVEIAKVKSINSGKGTKATEEN